MGLIGKVITGVVAVLLLIVAVLWFYGNPPAATATDDQGWSRQDKSQSYGIITVGQHEYTSPGQIPGGAIVATFGNFPVIDEGQYVPGILQDVAEKEGIKLEQTGTRSVTLSQLGLSMDGTVYKATKSGFSGRALAVDFPCPQGDGYVVAVGYGSIESAFTSVATYQNAVDLVESVTCG